MIPLLCPWMIVYNPVDEGFFCCVCDLIFKSGLVCTIECKTNFVTGYSAVDNSIRDSVNLHFVHN